MATKPEFVQIQPDEDVGSIKDRLGFLRGQRVLLIWPEKGTALTRKLDLVLIQREAMRRAIRLAFVTHDSTVIRHAEELNISTFETIGSSERGRWKRGRSKVFANRFQRPEDSPEPEELVDVASRVRSQPVNITFMRWFGVRLALFLLLLGVVLGIGYVFVPSAVVYVTPAQQLITADVAVIADPNLASRDVDVENGLIPAIRLNLAVEDRQSIDTTGVQDLEDITATGSVIFVNQTGSVITIPSGTQVSTGTGTPIFFRTIIDVSVPAGNGQEAEARIEALPASAGRAGNVEPNLINTVVGPLEDSVNVINRVATTGGETRSVRVVSQQDRENLLNLMRQQLQARAFVEMQPSLADRQFIVDETIRIIEERADETLFSAQVGDVVDTLTLSMSVVVEAIAIDEDFAERVVFAYLSNQIARGRTIEPETITYSRGAVSTDVLTQTISFTVSGSASVRGQIDVDQLRNRLSGRSISDAVRYIVDEVDIAENSLPQIDLSPGLFRRMPVLPMRINVVVQN
ncbi:MAG: hypothetical protein RLP44_15150 [Aggregatilineales bacterium]